MNVVNETAKETVKTAKETWIENLKELSKINEINVLENPLTDAQKARKEELIKAIEIYDLELNESLEVHKKEATAKPVEVQFNRITEMVSHAKNIDELVLNIVYDLTDCNSVVIRDYRNYRMSLNPTFAEFKFLESRTKKEIFKLYIDEVVGVLTKATKGMKMFNPRAFTALIAPIQTIVKNYELVIDLHFKDTEDTPLARVELIATIAKVFGIDSKTKEYRSFKFDKYTEIDPSTRKMKCDKIPVLSKNEILALNTQKSQVLQSTYYTYNATTLKKYIDNAIKEESQKFKAWELEQETIKKETQITTQA